MQRKITQRRELTALQKMEVSLRSLSCKLKADLVLERRLRNMELKVSEGAESGKLNGQW